MRYLIILIVAISVNSVLFAIDLDVEIRNRKSNDSKITCGVFESEEGFPTDTQKRVMGATAEVEKDKTICRFKGLSNKTYAVSVMEDLNGNGKMDSTFVGFPKEPWGVSNDAPMQTFGPPKFEEAKFQLTKNKRITIKLNRQGN